MTADALDAGRTDATEPQLWQRMREHGDNAAREALFHRHLGFARGIALKRARRYPSAAVDMDDAIQAACSGLLQAIDHFDPSIGVPFRGFAVRRILGAVRDSIDRSSEVLQQRSAARRAQKERLHSLKSQIDVQRADLRAALTMLSEVAVGLALGFMLEGTALYHAKETSAAKATTPFPSGYDSASWGQLTSRLDRELKRLPARERQILTDHYVDGVSFDVLAKLLGVSKGRISQLHRGALELLRKRLSNSGHFSLEQ